MKRVSIACLFWAGLCWLPVSAHAENCSGLPTSFSGDQFPKGDFFSNFNNSCYLIPLTSGNGGNSEAGDLNSLYSKIFFNNASLAIPPYEIILLGEFPNSRYFSIGLYDNHSSVTQNITDVNIVPLTSNDINPYEPGVAFVSGQHYGADIHLGGTPGNVQTGCMINGHNVESNAMDGTQRHPYINWNFDPSFINTPPGYLPHDVDTPTHSNPNTAGVVIIRSYLDLTAITSTTRPNVIIRDVASGCAYPAAYVTGTLTNVVTTNTNTGNTWLDQAQVKEHNIFAAWQSAQCWGVISFSTIQWQRQDEYTPGANPDAGYLIANVPAGLTQTLASAQEVLLIQFRVPTTPPTPCVTGCSRSGSEQMRYMSISFQTSGGGTLASLPDSCPQNPLSPCTPLVQDPNGNVNLVVGTGVTQPSWVTAANGYTWLDLSKLANYTELNEIAIRHILPSSWLNCATQQVPYKTGEATSGGNGLMGLYSPVITQPLAANLPPTAVAPTCPKGSPSCSTCASYPSGPPAATSQADPACGILPANATLITKVVTQCAIPPAAPGCDEVIVQSSPPLSIVGQGFGSFPLGLPYSGNSNFLQITDTTQGWSAGYTAGSSCTVSIGEWSDGLISLIANVNESGPCPMAAGDTLNVTVTNPQKLTSYTFGPITVAASSGTGTRKP